MKTKNRSVFLITGAASGIGAAIGRLAVKQGHQVMLADVNASGVKEVARSIGDSTAWIQLDIRSADGWERALDATVEKFGHIDVLLNNAAVVHTGYSRDVSLELHRQTMETNFIGPLTGTLAALRRFRAQGHGHVLTVCSMTAFIPFPGIASYGASKQALRAFHHAVALEERETPIHFTIVHPTSTETPMLEKERNDDAASLAFISEPVTPEFVADVVMTAFRKKSVEVFMPPEQAYAVRLLGTNPKKLRELFDQMDAIGKEAQRASRAATLG